MTPNYANPNVDRYSYYGDIVPIIMMVLCYDNSYYGDIMPMIMRVLCYDNTYDGDMMPKIMMVLCAW